MADSVDSFFHERHPWIGKAVRDIPSGTEGELTAVVQEPKRDHEGRVTTVRLAYIRPSHGGRELPTAAGNVQLINALR
ncbi:hypothetical protein ABZZ20_36700 [Streptomyces sp. NPDC006430]|uniref:hypothetical protein n=1 Tax=Streptomyces sp. NPDC006430 TaxID=3154299 RepID=UPI0033BBE6D8